MKIRLQKYLSQCGIASRRAAEEMIGKGMVTVNGMVARIGESVDPDIDEVIVNGKIVRQKGKKIYIILNKPRGYISSCSRAQGPAIVDLVKIEEKVFPVGRLDMNSEGLILLTNDGELANKLTHPRYGCEKEYEVQINSKPQTLNPKQIQDHKPKTQNKELSIKRIFEKGIELEDGTTKPCKVNIIDDRTFRIIIKEGKKRQIRRMCQAVGKKVVRLKRIRIKGLTLGSLETGKWRYLTEREEEELRK